MLEVRFQASQTVGSVPSPVGFLKQTKGSVRAMLFICMVPGNIKVNFLYPASFPMNFMLFFILYDFFSCFF